MKSNSLCSLRTYVQGMLKSILICVLSVVVVLFFFQPLQSMAESENVAEGKVEYSGHIHHWDDGTIEKKATCTESGILIYTCLDCGESYREEITDLGGHDFGDWQVTERKLKQDNTYWTTETRYCRNDQSHIQKRETPYWLIIINYDKNTTDDVSNMPSQQSTKRNTITTLSSLVPSRPGYQFKGWSKTPNGNVYYAPGDKYRENPDLTLYAVWGYRIEYFCGTGASNGPLPQEKKHNEPVTLSSLIPTRSGYQFIGWSTKTLGGKVEYAPGEIYNVNSDLKLYAVWENVYIIYYSQNTVRTVSNMPPRQEKKRNETLTLSNLVPSMTGWQFKGWSTTSDGKVEYAPGDTYSGNSNLTLYAVWQYGYRINYDKNTTDTVSNMPLQQEKRYDEPLKLSSLVPSRTGYRFKGWSTTPGGEKDYNPGETYKENSDLTLYAVWSEKCHSCEGIGYKEVTCSKCKGDGKILVKNCTNCNNKGTEQASCKTCRGTGKVVCSYCSGTGKETKTVTKTETCRFCAGFGRIYGTHTSVICPQCLGTGTDKSSALETITCTTCKGFGEVSCSSCGGSGKTKITCRVCEGKNYQTCSKTEKITCTACNGLGEQHTHSYGEGEVTLASTCSAEGVKKYTCSICGYSYKESIAKKKHTPVEIQAKEATCTEDGLTSGTKCSVCGTVLTNQTIIEKIPHVWDSGRITKAATCTTAGVAMYTCKHCGTTKTETIKATGHKAVTDKAVAATNTKTGLTEGSHCSVCGEVIKKQEIVPKTGKNGWAKESGKWFYYTNGTKATGWKQISKKWYFFKKDGSMAANEWCGGYWLNKDGAWTYKKKASWKKDKVGWWYGDTSGWYAKNQWQMIDDKWYYFNARGYIVTGTMKIGGKTYRFNSSGVCLNP